MAALDGQPRRWLREVCDPHHPEELALDSVSGFPPEGFTGAGDVATKNVELDGDGAHVEGLTSGLPEGWYTFEAELSDEPLNVTICVVKEVHVGRPILQIQTDFGSASGDGSMREGVVAFALGDSVEFSVQVSQTSDPPEDIDICDQGCLTAGSPTDQWIELTIDYTIPSGKEALARFTNLMAFAGGGTSGTVYFDACEAVVLNRFDGADADGDDDEDLYDCAEFQRCFSGDGVTPLQWNCMVFDSDDDEDIDLVRVGTVDDALAYLDSL